MKAWEKLEARIDALSKRERVLGFLAAMAVVFGLWSVLVLDPFTAGAKAYQAQLAQLNQERAALDAQRAAVLARAQLDPNKPLRERLEALKARIAKVDEAIQAKTGDFIPPSRMARLLEDLLAAHQGVTLVRLENLPPQAITLGEGGGAHVAPVYRHGLEIEFRADYFSTLEFLQAAEELPWHLSWDRLEYKVEEYPRARVILRIHTLSAQEDWISV